MSNTLFPHFLECGEFTVDPYWRDIFEACSNNRFPRGSSYRPKEHQIIIRKKIGNKPDVSSYNLSEDPKETFQILIDLFQNELGMHNDVKTSLEEEAKILKEEMELQRDNLSWNQVRLKSTKDQLIEEYANELENLYSLSKKEANQLNSLINVGIRMRQILPEDIVIENRKISEITTLIYRKNERKFYLDREPKWADKIASSKPTIKIDPLISYVSEFIKDHRKRGIITKNFGLNDDEEEEDSFPEENVCEDIDE